MLQVTIWLVRIADDGRLWSLGFVGMGKCGTAVTLPETGRRVRVARMMMLRSSDDDNEGLESASGVSYRSGSVLAESSGGKFDGR